MLTFLAHWLISRPVSIVLAPYFSISHQLVSIITRVNCFGPNMSSIVFNFTILQIMKIFTNNCFVKGVSAFYT